MDVNNFSVGLSKVSTFVRDGILFNNTSYIKLVVDGKDVLNESSFNEAFVYFEELKRSLAGDGKYLIFTCACGIADDGGWDGIVVNYKEPFIYWKANSINLNWVFDIQQYTHGILLLEKKIKELNEKIILEPQKVIFPENW